MKETFTKTEYPASLSREEYVRSQELLSKRVRGATIEPRIVSIVAMVLCIGMAVADFRISQTVDWSLVSLLVLLVGVEVWMMLSLPKQLRKRSEAAYDATLYRGYSFDGVITVEEDAIRKRTATATAVIPYEQCRLFMETADMMIFCGMDGKSIVIPARCLTEETAEITREAALAHVPAPQQWLQEKLIPAGSDQPISEPVAKSEDAVLTVEVAYTDNEIVSIATEAALQRFGATLPNRALLMTMLASFGYFGMNIKPLPLFLLGMVVLFLIAIMKARIKMRRAITQSERAICHLRVEFSQAQLLLIGKADGLHPIKLPWSTVTRAVECRDSVEFYTGEDRQLCIPKRCINDFEEFRRIVDSLM